MNTKRRRLSIPGREARNGYLYILPWLIGFLLFFISPIVQTVTLSMQTLDRVTLEPSFVGFEHFVYAFRGDMDFPRLMVQALTTILQNTPLILIFSYFVALLLKKKFRGAYLVKTVFFLTVILSADLFIRMQVENNSFDTAQMNGVVSESGQFFQSISTKSLGEDLVGRGLPEGFVNFITGAINNISYFMIRSGVQIFIFLAALNSIPESMYEAAAIEGSTAWETFWKITFPMTTPVIMVNIVYTVIDGFNSQINATINYIYDAAFKNYNYGYSAAMSIVYFITISAVLGVVFLLTRKRVYYQA